MTEDPLERIEREEREKKNRNGGLRTVTILLAVAALALGGALAWIWSQKSSLVNELEGEKAELTQQLLNLQGTLRSIMRGYIVQIDSLNTLNKRLTADAAAARKEAAESREANANLSRQVENLSGQVAAGAVIKARGLRLAAYNGSDKETDRSSRVKYFVASLSLLENEIAERGPVRVYVRVKDPNGILILNSSSTDFTLNGETLSASASREVDYEGQEVEMSIYVKDVGELGKGVYTVEACTERSTLGRAELMLR